MTAHNMSDEKLGDIDRVTKTSTASDIDVEARHPHKERHSGNGKFVRDSIIGFSDGLTVPFALTAGLSALGDSRIVIVGGLAELFAGAISMGLGAYLAAATERKHYEVEEAREREEVRTCPGAEEEEIFEIFMQYGIARHDCAAVVASLRANEEQWIRFMMDFELRLEKPDRRGACAEGLVMGVAYFLGGILPMIPYFAIHDVDKALFVSIGISVAILFCFGYVKSIITGSRGLDALSGAIQTLLVGAAAAGVSYGIVKAVNSVHTIKG